MTSIPTPGIWSRLVDVARFATTPLEPSHYLEIVNPLWSSRELHARVEAVRDEADGVRTLVLRTGRGFQKHRPGQHLAITLPIAGRRATRVFSISSSPDRRDGRIEVTIKAVRDGRVTPVLVRDVLPGTYVTLGQPRGDFVLPDQAPSKILFITAGSGITPVMSMLRTLARRREFPNVVHIHYSPREEDVIFREDLDVLAKTRAAYQLRAVVTGPHAGSISGEVLEQLCPDWREREAWACGPRPMLDTLEAISPAIRIERYQAKLAPPSAGDDGGSVRFAKSNVETRADGRTALLVVAETAGVSAPHGCRMGICHTCDVTLMRGCVRDLRTGQEISEPGARIQPCVCAAASDVEVDV